MSLILNSRPLVVIPELAVAIGLNEAIIIQQIHYWCSESRSGVEHNGRTWIYNTYEQWKEQFPFFSESTIKRALKSLHNQGLVEVEQLNKSKHDRTNFYSINYDLINQISMNSSNGSKWSHPQGQNGLISTETTTETTTENKTLSSSGDDAAAIESAFEAFWRAGMRKVGKQKARGIFKRKLKESKQQPHEFGAMLINDIKARIELQQMGFDKLHPERYLSNQRWEDEYADDRQQQNPGRQQMDWDSDFINDPNRLEL